VSDLFTEKKDLFASHDGDTFIVTHSDAAKAQDLIAAMGYAQSQSMDLVEQYFDTDLDRNVLIFKEKK
jgi:hypothetical protein